MNESTSARATGIMVGLGLGALLMYVFDPEQGRRRRALMQSTVQSSLDQLGDRIGDTLGETYGSHADTLPQQRRGDTLRRLAAQANDNRISALGVLAGAVGLVLAVRALRGSDWGERVGGAVRGRPVEQQESIEIAASPEEVYDCWTDYENFPRFMSMVEEVRPLDGDRSHWVVKGPAGTRVEWDSVITDRDRGRVLAWRSEPGSPVTNSGRVRLEPTANGTRATVQFSYQPPGGRIGHAVASAFGRNPKQDLQRDLERMKAFVERGRPGEGALRGGMRQVETAPH